MYNLKRIFDPLYGAVTFSEDEFTLINSAEMQRLRYVRLCNINSMLVTGASEISRFEHCLGVLSLAKHWAKTNKQALSLGSTQRNSVVQAALLHDVKTGPFGHSLQYVFEDNKYEEKFLHDDVKEATKTSFHQLSRLHFSGRDFSTKKTLGENYQAIAALIKGESEFGILISGTLDLDNLDNVFRLAFHVGIVERTCVKMINDFVSDVKVVDNEFIVSDESVKLLELWYETRKRLYELLLLDWAEFSAKAMLTRAIEYAGSSLGPDAWLYTDDDFLDYLENKLSSNKPKLGIIVKRIKLGDLYSPLCLLSTDNTNAYASISAAKDKRKIEEDIKKILKKITKSFSKEVLFHPILDTKKTCRKIDYVNLNGEKLSVGDDSHKIHLGIFTSSTTLQDSKLDQYQFAIKQYFTSLGLSNLEDINDPILNSNADNTENQREFEW